MINPISNNQLHRETLNIKNESQFKSQLIWRQNIPPINFVPGRIQGHDLIFLFFRGLLFKDTTNQANSGIKN